MTVETTENQQLRASTLFHLENAGVATDEDENLALINAVRSYLDLELIEREGMEDSGHYLSMSLIEILDEMGIVLDSDTASPDRISVELQRVFLEKRRSDSGN